MEHIEKKLDNIVSEVNEMKISMVKLESNYDKSIDILDRLTTSVEHHIKRTDELQDLSVDLKLQIELTKQDLQNKKDRDKLILTVLSVVAAIVLGLKELGLFDILK